MEPNSRELVIPPFSCSASQLQDLAHSRSRYWAFGGVDRLLEALRIDAETGVGSREGIRETYVTQYAIAEIKARQEQFGENVVPEAPSAKYMDFVWHAMKDITLIILCVAGILSLLAFFYIEEGQGWGYVEGVTVIGAVIMVVNLDSYQNWRKEQEFQKLNKELKDRKIHVIRYGGRYTSVKKFDIVVGDVIRLRVGDILVADGVLLSGGDVVMDESAMTGESEHMNKTKSDFLFSGTSVQKGHGRYLVTAVGVHSDAGAIAALVRGVKQKPAVVAVASNVAKTGANAAGFVKNKLAAVGNTRVGRGIKKVGGKVGGTAKNALLAGPRAMKRLVTKREKPPPEPPKPQFSIGPPVLLPGTVAIDADSSTRSVNTGGTDSPTDRDLYDNSSSWETDTDTDGPTQRTVLKKKLDRISGRVARIACVCGLMVFISLVLRYYGTEKNAGTYAGETEQKTFLEFFMTSMTIVVVAAPIGLPLSVTLALALAVRKMQAHHSLVKSVASAETMGSATTICTDKTGTLTQNQMTAVGYYHPGRALDGVFSADRTHPLGKILEDENFTREYLNHMVENVCLNRADAEVEYDPTAKKWTHSGNATDCALLVMADELGYDYYGLGRRTDRYSVVKRYAFSSERKMATTVVAISGGNDDELKKGVAERRERRKKKRKEFGDMSTLRAYTKGAPDVILGLCNRQFGGGEIRRSYAEDLITEMTRDGLRVIALACRELDTKMFWNNWTYWSKAQDEIEKDMTFIGLVGIADPIRPAVPRAVASCIRAGIDVRMITGDHPDTGVAIAVECGILRHGVDYVREREAKNKELDSEDSDSDSDDEPKYESFVSVPVGKVDWTEFDVKVFGYVFRDENVVMTGETFRNYVLTDPKDADSIDMQKFDDTWPFLRVLARCSPNDKYTLVKGMMESKLCKDSDTIEDLGIFNDTQVLAVTGDGSNDAPALKKADIGFAMGGAGTEVAKDAADVILMTDDFSSLVFSVLHGRNVHDSISKFLQFQVAEALIAVTVCTVAAMYDRESPLRTTQMIWVYLVLDSLGALALANEKPQKSLLNRRPYGQNTWLITPAMLMKITCQHLYASSVLLYLFFFGAAENQMDKTTVLAMETTEYRCDTQKFCEDFADYCTGGALQEFWPLTTLQIPNGRGRGHRKYFPSTHYTMIFHTFVFLSLFNWVNARKIYMHEWNFLGGLWGNKVFVVIWLFVIFTQWCAVQSGFWLETTGCHNMALRTKGLSFNEHLCCLVIGATAVPVQLLCTIFIGPSVKGNEFFMAKKKKRKSKPAEPVATATGEPAVGEGAAPAGDGNAAAAWNSATDKNASKPEVTEVTTTAADGDVNLKPGEAVDSAAAKPPDQMDEVDKVLAADQRPANYSDENDIVEAGDTIKA